MTEIAQAPSPLFAAGADPLRGSFSTPGDKSISHHALILSALAVGRSTIEGLLESSDVLATMAALRELGVRIERRDEAWLVHGLGVWGLHQPQVPLDFGNSGTGARLMMGLLAVYPFATRFLGAPTLTRRPMTALLEALAPMGVKVVEGDGRHLPMTLQGPQLALPLGRGITVASDQLKSALLLAALHIPGTTTLVEPTGTRDHVEKLLEAFGADVVSQTDDKGSVTIALTGLPELRPTRVVVPGDPSSAAYAIVAGLTVPGSDLLIENVLINPTRTGLIDTLLEMGGDIAFLNQRETAGEHVADLRVRSSRMKGVTVDAAHAGAMLDDIPALAIAAAYAQGETRIAGLAALREQECDRLHAVAAGLSANRVVVHEGEADLTVDGAGKVEGGGQVATQGDHRIAMSFLVLGLGSKRGVTVDDSASIAASFPGFVEAMRNLGCRFEPGKDTK